jgi:hypothetical protein
MNNPSPKRCSANSLGLLAMGLLLTRLPIACRSATVQAKPALTRETPGGQTAPSGSSQFLGTDTSLLRVGGEGRSAYVYIKPNVQWNAYRKVLLRPVQFWDTADSNLSKNDQQMLSSYFTTSFEKIFLRASGL